RSAASVEKGAGPSWLNEALSILVFGVALLLVLGVISYSFEDPTAGPRSNWLGPTGHTMAALLFGAFGWASVLIIGFFCYLSLRLWSNELAGAWEELCKLPSRLVSRGIGLVFALVCAAVLGSVFWGRSGGGGVGVSMSVPLVNGLNKAGTTILTSALLIVALALATGNSVQSLLSGLSSIVLSVGRFSFSELPMVVWSCVRVAARAALSTFMAILGAETWGRIGGIFVAHGRASNDEEVPLPKPRIRKNVVPREPAVEALTTSGIEGHPPHQDSEPEPVPEGTATDYSHVVVMRRDQRQEKLERKKLAVAPPTPAFTDINDAFPRYEHPDIGLLAKGEPSAGNEDDEELRQKSRQIEVKLKDFGIFGRV
ncbi:MAG: hypothetical protein EBZ48_17385, partial [Proteobacteria bacterium]|nr:hypothetical protein [Pseudomonadota bacterium]